MAGDRYEDIAEGLRNILFKKIMFYEGDMQKN
jgi:hypothetical protein